MTDESDFPSEGIEDAAAAWLVRVEEGLGPAEAAEFQRWRQSDPRNEEALTRLEESCRLLERMPELPEELKARLREPENAAGSRRRLSPFVWKTLALAAGLALTVAGWRLWPRSRDYARSYATTAGGYERVTLPDGSVVELNASSEVSVSFSVAERRVSLMAGEAQFTVAKNPARPFVVTAGQVSVRAVGTAFQVRLEKAAVEVFVSEGRVQVGDRNERLPPDNPVVLAAGQRVVIPTAGGPGASVVEKVDEPAIRSTLSWQAPRLVFVDTPLADVIAQFNRWNRVQLALGDAELASQPVGGNFRADNVEIFVRLLESSRDILVERPSPDRIVLHRAR